MPIIKPSQYDCDKMELGDMVVIKKPFFLYKWYRKRFIKDSIMINIISDWNNKDKLITQYSEDCILMFKHELNSMHQFEKEVPFFITYKNHLKPLKIGKLSNLKIGIENIQISFSNGFSIIIPAHYFKYGIEKVNDKLDYFNDNRLVEEQLKYQRHKGDYFRNYCIKNNINTFDISFCNICGEPVTCKFEEDVIKVTNLCKCGNQQTNIIEMTYDSFSIWYYSQVNKFVKERIDTFWFKK